MDDIKVKKSSIVYDLLAIDWYVVYFLVLNDLEISLEIICNEIGLGVELLVIQEIINVLIRENLVMNIYY